MRTATWLLAGLAAGATWAQTPKKYAVLVGVKSYHDAKLEPLPFAERDVADLAPLLKAANYQVRLLTIAAGDANPLERPTLANIERELAALLGRPDAPGRPGAKAKVAASDLVLIALAGHGLQPIGDKDSYFCPVDARPQDKATLLSVGGLIRSLDESGAGAKLLLVDACRNDPDPSRGRGLDGAMVQSLPQGVAALFSCSPGQRAFETAKAGGGHGVFFHFVLEGLKGEAANARGDVTWSGLSEFVTERVEAGVHEWIGPNHQQTPGEFKNFRGRPPVLLAGLAAADRGKADARPEMPARTESSKPAPAPEIVSASSGMEFKLIPAGTFLMGAPEGEAELKPHELPRRRVRFSRPFYMGKTEVTQAQYRAAGIANPSHSIGDNLPVETVSWFDAVRYCNALSLKDRKRPCYQIAAGEKPAVAWLADGNGYRLPTEAEWEYACRAGTKGPFAFARGPFNLDVDGTLKPEKVNYDGSLPYNGEPRGFFRSKTVAAGSLPANDFGLHEMHGNVWEWCWDAFGSTYYRDAGDTVDDRGPNTVATMANRVGRGGSWASAGGDCRSASRDSNTPDTRYATGGFRVVAVVE